MRRREFQTEVQERAQLELTKARESGGSSQRQLPETATLPRTTTGKPIGPVSTSYSQPQTLPRTTSGKPDGPGGRTYSQPSTLPRTTTGKPISPARRGPTQAQTSMTGPGISPRLQVHHLLAALQLRYGMQTQTLSALTAASVSQHCRMLSLLQDGFACCSDECLAWSEGVRRIEQLQCLCRKPLMTYVQRQLHLVQYCNKSSPVRVERDSAHRLCFSGLYS